MKGSRAFWHAFHGRGMTVEKLAGEMHLDRCSLTKILNGTRSGLPTRRKLIKAQALTPEEVTLLGWDEGDCGMKTGGAERRKEGAGGPVPHGTKCHVAQNGGGTFPQIFMTATTNNGGIGDGVRG